MASAHAESSLPVFPGAQGFGIDTPAGRGGEIVRVTSLAASGSGTLREALEARGPRVIVFEVGGVINLEGQTIEVSEPFLTVAGQTAPPPGITITHGGITIRTHNVLVQHIRIRPGDGNNPKRSGWEPDALTLSSDKTDDIPVGAHHVVIDHCSLTWAVDENLTASGPRDPGRTSHASTFSNCIVAEALDNSSHHKGPHSKGSLIHDFVQNLAVIGNLYACNADRNPVLKPGATAAIVNNLIYNPKWAAVRTLWVEHEYEGRVDEMRPCEMAVVGNVLWYGPNTPFDMPLLQVDTGHARVYKRDNHVDEGRGLFELTAANKVSAILVRKGIAQDGVALDEPPLWPQGLDPLPADEVPEHVLTTAGAWPGQRDAVDRRIIEGVRQRTGRIIDSQEEVGGYPDIEPRRHTLNIPDRPHDDDDQDGYTNLEEWLHARAAFVEGAALQSAVP